MYLRIVFISVPEPKFNWQQANFYKTKRSGCINKLYFSLPLPGVHVDRVDLPAVTAKDLNDLKVRIGTLQSYLKTSVALRT